MKLLTTRFGEIDLPDDSLITFPEGLQGLPSLKSFVFLRTTDLGLLRWLQSVDSPSLACVVCNPRLILPDYVARIPAHSVADLGVASAAEADLLVVLRHANDRARMTADLQRPIVYNPSRRLARHVVLSDSDYSRYHHVFSEYVAGVAGFCRRSLELSA